MKSSLATLPETILSERKDGIADQGHDAMRLQLYMLETRERELLQKYDDKHPLVRVAGFTQYWVEIGKPVQDEIIARTEYEGVGS